MSNLAIFILYIGKDVHQPKWLMRKIVFFSVMPGFNHVHLVLLIS